MHEWVTSTPWWVALGLIVSLGYGFFRASKWFGTTDNRLDALERRVETIGEDTKRIFDRLPTPTVEGRSPIQLTEFGTKISTAAGVKTWAADHAPNLADQVSGKSEFEVFETCVAYVAGQLEMDGFARTIRQAAYEHGTDAEQVKKVYEVELRDRLLATTDRPVG
ncbi:MAG: hypothetical protein OXF74_06660 [Rhodobacteraceae bacterium]|nr:hypothetical protein [Paracoccaceae bacterium]